MAMEIRESCRTATCTSTTWTSAPSPVRDQVLLEEPGRVQGQVHQGAHRRGDLGRREAGVKARHAGEAPDHHPFDMWCMRSAWIRTSRTDHRVHLRRRSREARLHRSRQRLRQHGRDLAPGRVRRRRRDRPGDHRRLDAQVTRRRWPRSVPAAAARERLSPAAHVRTGAKCERAGRPGPSAPRPERPRLRRALESLVAARTRTAASSATWTRSSSSRRVPRGAVGDVPDSRRLDVECFRPLCAFMPPCGGASCHGSRNRHTRRCAVRSRSCSSDQRHVRHRPAHCAVLHGLPAGRPPPLDPRPRGRAAAQPRAGALSAHDALGLGRGGQHGRAARDLARARRRPHDHRRARRLRDVPVLREEVAHSCPPTRVPRRVQMVDMVCAQVYAEYICEQGGSYLRADFSAPEDPMQHTRACSGSTASAPRTDARVCRHRRRGPRGLHRRAPRILE